MRGHGVEIAGLRGAVPAAPTAGEPGGGLSMFSLLLPGAGTITSTSSSAGTSMAEAKPTLDALRAEIDEIDDELHRLLMRRAQVALSIGALKNSHGPEAGFMRPSREARLLRRLAAKEDGPFPKAVIIRLWREVIGAVLRLQGPFSVAVHAPEGAAGYWDLARDHFGSLTPATAHDSPQQVLHAVTAGRAVVGILPLPDGGDPQPWWPMML